MRKRVIYRVIPGPTGHVPRLGQRSWLLKRGQKKIIPATHGVNKATAVAVGRTKARAEWEDDAQPTQLVIHKADGTIQTEHTYGLDPKRTKG